jgi:hypothetical protein
MAPWSIIFSSFEKFFFNITRENSFQQKMINFVFFKKKVFRGRQESPLALLRAEYGE